MQGARRFFLGGNWKANNLLAESKKLAQVYNQITGAGNTLDVVAFTPEVQITTIRSVLDQSIHVGAQDVSYNKFGAFTGETAAEQLADAGASWVLIGHSERRTLFGDTEEVILKKFKRVMESNLGIVYCIGETLDERQSGATNKSLTTQIETFANDVSDWNRLVIAYEPVWAIGTGQVATTQQAEDAHKFIRELIKKKASSDVAEKLRIIYGGSVKSDIAAELMSQPNIDGFLVGGASLKDDFVKIAKVIASQSR